MPTILSQNNGKCRGERGAALITTLLISALLLTAGGMLILTTSMSATNTVDAAAEMQAYYGAEAGLQAALNVMRGNVMPSPLFVANPAGAVAPENKITFFKAKTNSWSNLAGDPTTVGFPARLSRWISYNYTPPGGTYADRVGISTPPYNPFNGVAYSLTVTPVNGTGPSRLIIESTGYGPRGARKKLSILIVGDALGIEIPAMLAMRGHDDHTTPMTFITGTSAAKTYSGVDAAGLAAPKPAFAISNHDVAVAQAAYSTNPNTISDPKYNILNLVTTGEPAPSGPLAVAPPWFLDTANNARTFLAQAEALAQKKGRVLNSLNGPAGAIGAPEFIVVRGNCTLDGGAGLLIVEGDLQMAPSGPDFRGVILVLGKGTVNKTGGGNRSIYGAVMVAHFNSSGDFLEPTFDYGTGAGTSTMRYDSAAVAEALELSAPLVLGVVEK
jgi:Tfp pilus assembly protein PilX